jgi:hypothetical protein
MDVSLKWCSTPPLWHTKAVGGRPPHHNPIYTLGLRFRTYVVGRRNEPLDWVNNNGDHAELRSLMPQAYLEAMEAAQTGIARPGES